MNIPETSPKKYISGIFALNIPSDEGTGDWHASTVLYADRWPDLFICGDDQKYDFNRLFGSEGVFDCTSIITAFGLPFHGDKVYVATHARAIADMVVRLSTTTSPMNTITLDDWMHTQEEKQRVITLLSGAISKIEDPKGILEWITRNS